MPRRPWLGGDVMTETVTVEFRDKVEGCAERTRYRRDSASNTGTGFSSSSRRRSVAEWYQSSFRDAGPPALARAASVWQ